MHRDVQSSLPQIFMKWYGSFSDEIAEWVSSCYEYPVRHQNNGQGVKE